MTIGPILRDRVVILQGLKPGEYVATAGNFLIDSQMQLAGKPSLIDVSKLREAPKPIDGPLRFEGVSVAGIPGNAGELMETLYTHYFKVQKSLAADQKPAEASAVGLHRTAVRLLGDETLAKALTDKLKIIADESAHLHHQDLAGARRNFKPISHAILELAVQARGDKAASTFTHFYCPMVKGGGGDWLQAEGELLNPYYGSEMLRCGEKVEALALPGESKPTDASHDHHHAEPTEGNH